AGCHSFGVAIDHFHQMSLPFLELSPKANLFHGHIQPCMIWWNKYMKLDIVIQTEHDDLIELPDRVAAGLLVAALVAIRWWREPTRSDVVRLLIQEGRTMAAQAENVLEICVL